MDSNIRISSSFVLCGRKKSVVQNLPLHPDSLVLLIENSNNSKFVGNSTVLH